VRAVALPPRERSGRAEAVLQQSAPSAPSRGATVPAVQHLVVGEDGADQRLDNYLLKTLKGVPKTHVYRIIRSGEVRVNRGRAAADTRLALGDELRLPPVRVAEPQSDTPAPPREFPVVFEDEHLIAIDKPAGVAVHGGSGVSFGVIEQLRRARPAAAFLELVHRLDRETSGLLLIAKKRSALTGLQAQFRARETGKTYAALVPGTWPASRRLIDIPLHKYLDAEGERRVRVTGADDPQGQRSITLVQAVEPALAGHSLLDVTIKTGRTHQIRVHLANEGHAILGDDKYGDFALNRRLARGETVPGLKFDRMFLHARRLRFAHPASGEPLELLAPLPRDCEALLRALATLPG
jgi:23S rRNA pseudouridine955/2504/2580 synthase